MSITIVSKVLDVPLVTHHGHMMAGAFRTMDPENGGREADHLLIYQDLRATPCLLRVNSACYTGDVFGDRRCDCNWQLEEALRVIAERRQGLLIYHLHHEGRGNGIVEKLRSYAAGDSGFVGRASYEVAGVSADAREYRSTVAILEDLGIECVALLTNNPGKARALTERGVVVVEVLALRSPDPDLSTYYQWKREDFGHHV
jgi:3,4-dihydroxy 2-butanone 4-phosphate synthase/GTP cyclohydrolase II